ncbi:MAG TPA: sigma-E factor negative regulatory protein [Steroidobacteraceae bacterium]|nr:sigma-E factor negative regulatory protein [Steroidobacteraceae bacterium]
MSEISNDQLSALIDGELPASETALLLRRLADEPLLRQRLARYCACGAALQGGRARADFALRVSAALVSEPAHRPARIARPALRRYLTPLAGLAIAATVAGAAILVLGRSPALDTRPAELARLAVPPAQPASPVASPAATHRASQPATLAAASAPAGSEPASYVTPAAHQGLGVIPRAELANYVVAHSEVSASLGMRSVLTNLVADEPAVGAPPP